MQKHYLSNLKWNSLNIVDQRMMPFPVRSVAKKFNYDTIGPNIGGAKMRKVDSDNWIADRYIVASAHKIWQDQPSSAEALIAETLRIIDLAHRRNSIFFSGKSKKGIVGGLFYCLGSRLSLFKTQKEIARSLGTTEMTVRASSRAWQKQFPDLVKGEWIIFRKAHGVINDRYMEKQSQFMIGV